MNQNPQGEVELIDLLERVVQAGIVVEPWLRVQPEGIALAGSGFRLVADDPDRGPFTAEQEGR